MMDGNHLPRGDLLILGDPEPGETLIARPNGIKDDDGILYPSARFQWFQNGEPIEGENHQFFLVTTAHLGKRLSCVWSYSDKAGNSESVASEPLIVFDDFTSMMVALYSVCFGRQIDDDGLEFWLNERDKGVSPIDIVRHVALSPEALKAKPFNTAEFLSETLLHELILESV